MRTFRIPGWNTRTSKILMTVLNLQTPVTLYSDTASNEKIQQEETDQNREKATIPDIFKIYKFNFDQQAELSTQTFHQ